MFEKPFLENGFLARHSTKPELHQSAKVLYKPGFAFKIICSLE